MSWKGSETLLCSGLLLTWKIFSDVQHWGTDFRVNVEMGRVTSALIPVRLCSWDWWPLSSTLNLVTGLCVVAAAREP